MGLTRSERETLNEVFDEALWWFEGDHQAITTQVLAELRGMEGGGIEWVGDFLEACLFSGLSARLRQRARAGRIAIDSESVPTCYVTGGSMTSWLHVPVDELDPVVERLHDQAETLNAHARIIERGQDAARKNGVPTAYEGFTADGVLITQVSA